MMSEDTKPMVCGELDFGRFACACLLIPNGTRGDITDEMRAEYMKLVFHQLPYNPNEATLVRFRHLTRNMFPIPTLAFATFSGMVGSDYINRPWDPADVRRYWYYYHVPWEIPGYCGVFNPCSTHIVNVVGEINAPDYVYGVYTVSIGDNRYIAIDAYGLKPAKCAQYVIHQNVFCNVFDPTVQRNSGRASVSDHEHGLYGGGEVIRPQELPTDSPATVPAMHFISRSRDFDVVGKLPAGRRSLVDEEDPGDVKIGVPATVLPPTTPVQCDCGHECTHGGQCKHDAPLYIQTGGPEPVESVLFGNHFDGNPS